MNLLLSEDASKTLVEMASRDDLAIRRSVANVVSILKIISDRDKLDDTLPGIRQVISQEGSKEGINIYQILVNILRLWLAVPQKDRSTAIIFKITSRQDNDPAERDLSALIRIAKDKMFPGTSKPSV